MSKTIIPIIIVSFLLLPTATTQAGKLYRWVDDQGLVHYTDKIPPQHSDKEHVKLNEEGVAVERKEAAKSREEIEREKELERLRAEQHRLIQEQKAADRVLARTFRSEDDIELARDGKLASVDVMIQVTRSNIKRLKHKLGVMQKNAAALERSGRQVSRQYLQDIENTRLALKDAYGSIIRNEQHKSEIRKAANHDINRFRSLKNLRPKDEDGNIASSAKDLFFINVYDCPDKTSCDQAWSRVENFVTKNASTHLQMVGDYIIMSASPLNDNDLSITVSRIVNDVGDGAKLFMDLQCKESPLGKELCASERIAQVRQSFRPAVAGNVP